MALQLIAVADYCPSLMTLLFCSLGGTKTKPSSPPTDWPSSRREAKRYRSDHETRRSSPSTQFHSDRGRSDKTRLDIQTSPPFAQTTCARVEKSCCQWATSGSP